MDIEIKKQLEKANKEANNPVDDDSEAKFQFKKKGKLTKKEKTEIKRTHRNLSDWVKVLPKDTVKTIAMEEEDQDDWMREEIEKEERLSRMEMRRMEWEK